MLRMLRIHGNSTLFGLSAVLALNVSVPPHAAAQRPTYPIVREIDINYDCRILLAPADPAAGKKKPQLERDSSICHFENVLHSEHMEEAIDGNELLRSRVEVEEHGYVLQNISDEPVIFVVEQPVPKGWQVDSDPQPVKLLAQHPGGPNARELQVAVFRVNAAPGEIVHLHVGERHTRPLKTKVLKPAAIASSGSR
jgi:hypothetical protein